MGNSLSVSSDHIGVTNRVIRATILLCALLFSFSGYASAKPDMLLGNVPLPDDVSPASSDSPFTGIWVGRWDNVLNSVLVVESISSGGNASVVYAVAGNPHRGFNARWVRYNAKIQGDTMTLVGAHAPIRYERSPTGKLLGYYGNNRGFGVFQHYSGTALEASNTDLQWTAGKSEFLQTALLENEKSVSLETVIYKPSGDGPFPLAVVNHGSTGFGNKPEWFTHTWVNDWFAEFLNRRGWLVAYVQRRGRGRSDGLYDEGFHADRSNGYTCNSATSLAGAERAMADLDAAIDALLQRDDVIDAPVLLAGQSRGGILSMAFAGQYPDRIAGVVNFVGGWLGEGCDTSTHVNQTLFKKAAGFGRHTLSLYGENDTFYSIKHCRDNFDAFLTAGGKGDFNVMEVAGDNNGHWVMAMPALWQDQVKKYLNRVSDQ
ncbi:MAG: alpha/beta fold hydrolase [Pseudomonadota bacterium]